MHAKIKLSYPTQLTTQLTAPKTVEWLGIYAQFKGIGLFARGGGCMGTTTHINTHNTKPMTCHSPATGWTHTYTQKHTTHTPKHKIYDMPLACHRMDTHRNAHNTHTQHKIYDMPLACHRIDTHTYTQKHTQHTQQTQHNTKSMTCHLPATG